MNLHVDDRRGLPKLSLTGILVTILGGVLSILGAIGVYLLGFVLTSLTAIDSKLDSKINPIANDVSVLKADISTLKETTHNAYSLTKDHENRLRSIEDAVKWKKPVYVKSFAASSPAIVPPKKAGDENSNP